MLKKSKTLLSLTLSIVLAGSLLVGCSSKPTTDKPAEGGKKESVEVSFMGWGNPTEKEVFDKLIKKYEEKFTNVKVNYVNVPPADYMVKLQAMVAGNKAPDVFYMPCDNFLPWVSSGKLEDLTPYLDKTTLFKKENVWQQAWERYSFDKGSKTLGKGNVYALPKDVGPWAMVYNKNLFKEAGVAEPDPNKPWTWDEFRENAKKLTKGEGANKIFGAGSFTLESAVWSNGADWLDPTKTKVTVDDPKFAEAMQFVADLTLVDKVAPNQEESKSLGAYDRFINGKVATFWMGPWDQPAFWKLGFEWDLMPAPVSPKTGKSATWLGSMGFAVSPQSKHKQEAFDLAAFLSLDTEGQKANYEMGQAVPNLIDMAKGDFMKMDKAPKNKQEFINIIEKTGRPTNGWYTYNTEWLDIFNQNAAKVWEGKQSAADFCKEIQPKMQAALDKAVAESKK